NVAKALKNRGSDVGITFVASAANSIGLSMIGGGSLDQALELLTRGEADSAIVMENDLYRHAAKDKVDAALDNVANLIVVDHQRTAIMDKANLILSAASFAESDGTLVNQEGRAQRFFQVYDPTYYDDPKKPESRSIMLESWRWLHSLHSTYTSRHVDWTQLDHVIAACVEALPQLQGIVEAAPDATFRIRGQRLARSPHRYSGRTAMRADISVHEPRQPQDIDTPFSFSMEGNNSPLADRQQIPFAWAPGWNSPQAWNKFQAEVGGSLRFGDPGVRLIEAGEGTLDYFDSIPAAFTATAGNWQIAPYYHLFGSEEMSQRSDVIQQRMPTPYVMVNPADAAALGVNLGTLVEFNCAGQTLRLPVRLSDTLAPGQVGLPLGLPGIPPILVGARVEDLREAVQ
ncbi:molybdopterin-dependent oxidoreductase, partial [Yersinia pestis]